jgi:hypothetical protein
MKPTPQVVENVRLMFKDEDADWILANMRWSNLLEHWLFDWAGMSWQVDQWGQVNLNSAKFVWGD